MLPSITTIYGNEGTIKSSLTITWPPPIAFYNLEGGGRRAWGYEQGIADGTITERNINIPHRSLIDRYEKLTGYREAWKELTLSIERDLKDFATVVLDTGTVVWAVDRDAYLQEIQETQNVTRKQLLQIEYGEPNRRITGVFDLARASQTNLVLTHHEADEYASVLDPSGKPIMDENKMPISYTTGKRVPEGFKHTLALSDWVIRTTLDDKGVPHAKIEKSGYGLHLRGRDIEWPTYEKIEAEVNAPVEVANASG